MKIYSLAVCVIVELALSTVAYSQQPTPPIHIAPEAPVDKPVAVKRDEKQQFEEAIRPYIAMAKKTYPEAKERFVKGLPPRQSFFMTTRLHDASGKMEQVFIAVREIKGGIVNGTIATDIQLVSGFKAGDTYSFPEIDLIDWTITKPDGSEEGNFVGKFLDTYRPQYIVETSVWRNQPATPARMSQRIEEASIKYQANAPIPRVILSDIGYPRTEEEYVALGGNAVILVTVLCQDKNELPLARLYVAVDGKETDLKQIQLVLSEQTTNKTASVTTFGAFRADALYLLPIRFRTSPGDLMADFARNKSGFKVLAFGTPVSEDVGKVIKKSPNSTAILEGALEAFIKREFPSFFD
jgi:hypothetical protein